MRLKVLVLMALLACSTSSAMWRSPPSPAPSATGAMLKKLELFGLIAAGIWVGFELFISDDGIIAYFEDEPHIRSNEA